MAARAFPEAPELPPYFASMHIAGGNHAVYTASQMHAFFRLGVEAGIASSLAEQPDGAEDKESAYLESLADDPRLDGWCPEARTAQSKDKPA